MKNLINRAFMAKKKTILTLLSFMLLSSVTWADDVLFKMAPTQTSGSTSIPSGGDLNLGSNYYYYVGGSALVHNGQSESVNVISDGLARITTKAGYIKITLPTGTTFQTGDVISVCGKPEESNTYVYVHKNSGTDGREDNTYKITYDANKKGSYTITGSDVLNGESSFYINYGSTVSYIKSVTVSRPSSLVKFYSFEEETVRDFTSAEKVDLGNGLQVNSDGASTYNGIKANSGKPNALYLKGANSNRCAELTVSNPCTVEIWGWAGNASNYLAINKGTYAAPASATKVLGLTEANAITYSDNLSYQYNEFGTTLYITPTGGFNIAAIRVVYKEPEVITSNSGTLNPNKNIWTSTTDNITIAEETATQDAIKKATNAVTNFSDKSENNVFQLTGNKTYKVSVPTNKTIVSAYIEACANSASTPDAKLKVNGGSWTNLSYSDNSTDPTVFTSAINATSFTIETNSRAAQVQIKLLLADLGHYPVTITGGWASFCAAENVELPDGLTAYRGIEGSYSEAVMLEEVEGNILSANQGFILGGTDGAYNLTVTDASATATSNLGYTTCRTALPSGTIYCLNSDEGAFQQYEGAYIPANKAYYRIASAGLPPRKIPMRIVQKDNTATAIENSEFIPLDHNAPVYNLQGQQVQITASGIYIQNGHKYLILK